MLLLLFCSSPSSSVSICRAVSILLHHVISIELLLCLKLVLPFKNCLTSRAHCYTLRVLVAYNNTTFLRWLSPHLLLHHDNLLLVKLLSLSQLMHLLLRLHNLGLDLLQLLQRDRVHQLRVQLSRGDLAQLTDRCREYGARAEVRTMHPDEWMAHGLCPCMRAGEELPQCAHLAGLCASGTVLIADGVPYIYLSDRESADGHVITVRHEMAHVLTACTGGSLYSHADPRVWGADGVVWAP